MTALTGKLNLSRCLIMEVVEDANVTPRYIVAGTTGSASQGGMGMMGKTDSRTRDGAFRTYGNGVTRLILGSGKTQTQTLALRVLDSAQLETLYELTGHTVIYCDTYGRRLVGAYLGTTGSTIPHSGGLTDVNIVIQTVTYDEAV